VIPFSNKQFSTAVAEQNRIAVGMKDERMLFSMRISFRRCTGALAIAIAMGMSCLTAPPANAAPFFQVQDYSKNRNYQQGMREGKNDGAHHEDHSKKRHFKRDGDQKAYEAGYQKGHGN
jgi:hypothetical protein